MCEVINEVLRLREPPQTTLYQGLRAAGNRSDAALINDLINVQGELDSVAQCRKLRV
jgi:hypothetical protein